MLPSPALTYGRNGAVGAADRDVQHHVAHQRLHARIEIEQIEVAGAAGELEEIRRHAVVDFEAEDVVDEVAKAAAQREALLEFVVQIVDDELVGGAAEHTAEIRREQPVGARGGGDRRQHEHEQNGFLHGLTAEPEGDADGGAPVIEVLETEVLVEEIIVREGSSSSCCSRPRK